MYIHRYYIIKAFNIKIPDFFNNFFPLFLIVDCIKLFLKKISYTQINMSEGVLGILTRENHFFFNLK